jgi:hypothetical protein
MTVDSVIDRNCQEFCSEDCDVDMNASDARHRSSAAMAVRGGPMGDKTIDARRNSLLDIIPSVSIEQHPFRGEPKVVLHINAWITDRTGWVQPADLRNQGAQCVMTPERAEHLAELLLAEARTAREAKQVLGA